MHSPRFTRFLTVPSLTLIALAALLRSEGAVPPPAPCLPVPSPRQQTWHQLEFYGFLHFTVNTFTDKEWGYGDESESVFNPTALDARQWARVAKQAGMKGLIITAKHHDGFCLWPSRYTEHSVKNSPWRGGKGDVVRELANACRAAGLKFGVYLSPWDRNHRDYGKPEYLTYYRNQLRELLTEYGPTFEVWFDGANGGDGFYGGARETRRINNAVYYDWKNTWQIVRELQPQAVMFSDGGPDVRWVGNESGVAFEDSWLTIDQARLFPGVPGYEKVAQGNPYGTDWVPPEVDVSIRPGWFYHPTEDAKVKTVDQLLEIYYTSVGRGANLLLNLPPDRRGLIHETDVERLLEFRRIIDQTFKTDLARKAKVTASNVRGNAARYAAQNLLDGNPRTYWSTDDGQKTATLDLSFRQPVEVDRVLFQEEISLGQRVLGWELEGQVDGAFKPLAHGQTIGYKRIVRTPPVTVQCLRLKITKAKFSPALSTFAAYRSPTR